MVEHLAVDWAAWKVAMKAAVTADSTADYLVVNWVELMAVHLVGLWVECSVGKMAATKVAPTVEKSVEKMVESMVVTTAGWLVDWTVGYLVES